MSSLFVLTLSLIRYIQAFNYSIAILNADASYEI